MAPSLATTLLFVLLFLSLGGRGCDATFEKTWCVANPSSDERTLQANIDFACSHVDCKSVIEIGKPCFYPNTPINHASVVMNLYYQAKGRNPWNCDFSKSALVTVTNPSYGVCTYI